MAKLQLNSNDRYLRLITQFMSINREYELTDFEIKVLDEVCHFYIANQLLTVSHLLRLKELASSAKIHLSMKRLVKKKMIVLATNEEDERIRFVKPSSAAMQRLEKLNHVCS